MLKLQEKGKPSNALWIVNPSTTIGSDDSCDFVVPSKKVAAIHIELKMGSNEEVTLVDRSKGKTFFVNDFAVGSYGPLKHGDRIKLGDTELEILDPKQQLANGELDADILNVPNWRLRAVSKLLEGREYPITGKTTLGRDAQCTIPIAGTHLSRRHAEIMPGNDGLLIRDLGSVNGTFVNGKRVEQAFLRNGDRIRFDNVTFEIVGPPANEKGRTLIREKKIEKPLPQPAEDDKEDTGDKKWKMKPTSPGNREQIDLYKKQPNPHNLWLLGALLLVSFVALVTYYL
jgi:pSer/pThr/pTyr-binding forkhead associated (FHA) protein